MLKVKHILLITFFFLQGISAVNFWTNFESDKDIDLFVNSMTEQELLGQLFMAGYAGGRVSREELNIIKKYNIGSIKIFGRNARNLYEMADSINIMQDTAKINRNKIPLFIATDQEGGWVRHIKGNTSITPGNMAIGASGISYDAYYSAFYIGSELKKLGINLNLAPAVDILINSEAHVIGPRSFSDDPVKTAILSCAFFKGMQDAGIICAAKHFPGHGNANKDSHGSLPIINSNYDEIWEKDLVPYRFLVKEGIPAVLTGHLAFPKITGNITPSSLSSFFQKNILREKLGFKGMIITDDLYMHGVMNTGLSISQIVIEAINAGNDIVMIPDIKDIKNIIWPELIKEVKNNTEFYNKVKDSARRIIKCKIKYFKDKNSVPLKVNSNNIAGLKNRESIDFFRNQAFRSATVINSKKIPVDKNAKILLVGQFSSFINEGSKHFPNADKLLFNYAPFDNAVKSDIDKLKAMSNKYDIIIFCLANPNSFEVLKNMKGAESEIIAFSVLNPIYLKELDWIKTAIAVYGTGYESFQAGFLLLTGEYESRAKFPLNFNDN